MDDCKPNVFKKASRWRGHWPAATNTGMKNLLFLVGLFLAAMAFVAIRSAVTGGWDVFGLLIGAAFAAGSVAVLLKAGRLYDSTKPPA